MHNYCIPTDEDINLAKSFWVHFSSETIQYILDYLNTRLYEPSISWTQPWLDCARTVVTLSIEKNFSEVRRMAEKLKSKSVRSTYEHVRSTAWTHSMVVWNAFQREAKRIRTRSQMRSNEKPNAFEREAKCVRTRIQTRSNKNPKAFEWETDHVCSKSEMHSNETPNAFFQHPKLVQSYPLTVLIND